MEESLLAKLSLPGDVFKSTLDKSAERNASIREKLSPTERAERAHGFMHSVLETRLVKKEHMTVGDIYEKCMAEMQMSKGDASRVISSRISGARMTENAKRAYNLIQKSGRQDEVNQIIKSALTESQLNEKLYSSINKKSLVEESDAARMAAYMYIANHDYTEYDDASQASNFWQKGMKEIQKYGAAVSKIFIEELKTEIPDMLAQFDKKMKDAAGATKKAVKAKKDEFTKALVDFIKQHKKTLGESYLSSLREINYRPPLDEAAEARGIKHIEDLEIDQFIKTLRDIDEYDITEKLDGSNLIFGLKNSKLYTVRKNQAPIFSADDYPKTFATNYMRAAHMALESIIEDLREFGSDYEIETEVLYGSLPNAIRYTKDLNWIVFLLSRGENKVDVKAMGQAVSGKKVRVQLDVVDSKDGQNIEEFPEDSTFQFTNVPKLENSYISKDENWKEFQSQLDELEAMLKEPSGVGEYSNAEILALKLNKTPDDVEASEWKELKGKVKERKQKIVNVLYGDENESGTITDIKSDFLKKFVRKVSSKLGPDVTDGGWIEGLVLAHPDGTVIKMVDKDIFGKIKKFAWQVRDEIAPRAQSIKQTASIAGQALIDMGEVLGDGALGTSQASRIVKKTGDSANAVIKALTANTSVDELKHKWVQIADGALSKLDKRLAQYQKEKDGLNVDVEFDADDNRSYTYDEELDKRTLQVFAQVKKQMSTIKEYVATAKNEKQLVMAFLGGPIERVFGK